MSLAKLLAAPAILAALAVAVPASAAAYTDGNALRRDISQLDRQVEGSAGDLAGVECACQRVGVDHGAARRVHQVGRGLHTRERLVADQAARLRRERAVEGHEVGALEQLLERHRAAAARGEELAAEALEAAADASTAERAGQAADAMRQKRKRNAEAWSAKHEAEGMRGVRREKRQKKKEAERNSNMTEEEKLKARELDDLLAEVRRQNHAKLAKEKAAVAGQGDDEFGGFD